MDIYEIRRRRLIEVMNDRFNGRQVTLAKALERQANHINRLVSSGKNQKHIGEKFARACEIKLGLTKGWLDQLDSSQMPLLSAETIAFAERYESLNSDQKRALEAVMQALVIKSAPPAVEQDKKH